MRRNLLAVLAPVLLGAAIFAAPTLAPVAFAQDANRPSAESDADAAKLRSLRNLKQLALAAQNFADAKKPSPGIAPFPARYSVDANGKPLHSWRVFLLPFIEQNELYKQIRLDEPWDSEWNRQFHSKAPELFRRPGSDDPGCVYACVVDKTGALQPAKEPGSQLGVRLAEITDGTSNTILFVERKEPVCWMNPEADLTLDEFLATVADAPDAVPTVFVDGRAALLPKSSEPSVLKAYVTRAGGEVVPQPPVAPPAAPANVNAKLAVQRLRSVRNLKQLVLATHNFLDSKGAFPARYSVDANGVPLHSWRVFLLPFIEQEELYKQIRLDEPWDSEHNRQFHSKTPELFRRPDSDDKGCVYVCVAAERAALQPAKEPGSQFGVRLGAFTDGVANTILYVERNDKTVCWMDPEADLTLDEFLATVAEGSAYPAGGTNVGMCDGRVRALAPDAKPEILKALVTSSGDVDLLP